MFIHACVCECIYIYISVCVCVCTCVLVRLGVCVCVRLYECFGMCDGGITGELASAFTGKNIKTQAER